MVNDPADERTAADPRNQLGQNALAHAIARIGLYAHFWPVTLVFPLARGIKPLVERVDPRIFADGLSSGSIIVHAGFL